ncbi:MAG: CBS domain-containing protein, partial [Dehalococcoidales bacterium]|nr:CBS domain-containing protein [Dehalococcoidales bacterium]
CTSSPDFMMAIRLASRIAIMKSGELVQYDTPQAILSRPADRFVHDFIGTDRELKRLSSISILSYIRPAPSIMVDASSQKAAAAMGKRRYIWVVAENGQLMGWLDKDKLSTTASVREAMVIGNIEEIAVTNSATLHEALSRMLGQGFKSIPVVDEKGRFIGEVTLGDIEAATAEVEN